MAHYRQGHSVCVSGPDHLIVTGSIRDAVGHKVEQYCISENSWKELPDLRVDTFGTRVAHSTRGMSSWLEGQTLTRKTNKIASKDSISQIYKKAGPKSN